MNLDEVMETIKKSVENNKIVARVHTGDPSIYGAIREQMDRLEEMGFPMSNTRSKFFSSDF